MLNLSLPKLSTKVLVILIVTVLIIVACCLIYKQYNNTNNYKLNVNNSNNKLKNNLNNNKGNDDGFNLDIVPSGNVIEGFNNEDQLPFEQLTQEQQKEKCQAISQDILGYRNKLSGATFRFQKLDKFDTDNNDFFLLGNIGNGMVIEANEDTSLKYATKDSSNDAQKFVRTKINNDVYFKNKAYPDYALQYEHEHLSLRTHDSTPTEGQKFVLLAQNDKALKDAVSFGIGQPHLNKDDLNSKGPRTFVFMNSDGSTTAQTDVNQMLQDPALEQLTHDQLKDVVGNILRDYNQYKQSEEKLKGGVFGDKPIQFNLNLSDGQSSNTSASGVVNVEGFTNMSRGNALETFVNLRYGSDNDTSLDVRELLNRYSQQQQMNTYNLNNTLNSSSGSDSLGNLASANINNNNLAEINSVSKELDKAAAGTSFQGCPKIDRSKYLTGRQVARCYGCNADSSLQ